MRVTKYFFLVFSLVIMINCTKENEVNTEKVIEEEQNEEIEAIDEPDTVVYFTYNASELGDLERWIIVHDVNGKLLDYQQETFEGPMIFNIDKDSVPEKINITKLSYNKFSDGSSEYHRVLTYTDIDVESVWDDNNSFITGNLIGTFDFKIENINEYEWYTISTLYNTLRPGDYSTEVIDGKTTLNLFNIPLYENLEYFINIRGVNGRTKYFKINPENEGIYIQDFSNFLEFDDYIGINLPENLFYFLQSGGIDSDQSNSYWGEGQPFVEIFGNGEQVPEIGFLDGYANYKFGLAISFLDYSYSYYKIGDKVSEISIPSKPAFTLINEDVYHLEFSSDLNPLTKNTNYVSEVQNEGVYLNTSWDIYSTGSKTQELGSLPIELLERFPNINVDDLNLSYITLYTEGFEQQQFFIDRTSKIRNGNLTSESFRFDDF
jgi:hypothetical protein